MNTFKANRVTTTVKSPLPAGGTPRRGSSRKSRIAASAVAAVGLGLAGVFGATAPASAATTPGGVVACFTFQFGGVVGPYNTINSSASIDAKINGTWYSELKIPLNSNGCVSAYVTPGYVWRVSVNDYLRPYRYVGSSPYVTQVVRSGAVYSLGTGRVTSVYVG